MSRRLMMGKGRHPVAGGGLDADTTAWINAVVAASGTVSATQQTRVDTLITGMKSAGVWTLCDELWIWAGEGDNTHRQQGTIGIRHLTSLSIPVGTQVFNWRGWESPSANAVLDSTINPNVGGFQYGVNAASVGLYIAQQGATVYNDGVYNIGASVTGHVRMILNPSLSTVRTIVNDATAHDSSYSVVSAFKTGFWLTVRTAGTGTNSRATYRNGTQLDTWTQDTIAVPNASIVFMGRNDGGGSYNPQDQDYYCIGWIGGALNATQAGNLSTLILAYLANYNIRPVKNYATLTQEFDQWSFGAGPNLAVTPNATTAPDLTSSADLLYVNATTSFEEITISPTFASGTMTFSVYAKPFGGWQWLMMRMFGSIDSYAWFDLSGGVVGGTSGSGVTNAIASKPNGWFLCSITTTSPTLARLSPVDANNGHTQTANATPSSSGIYLWGAQVEEGSSVSAYNRQP